MPAVTNIRIGGVELDEVVGKAYYSPRGSVRLSDALDGSSLNISTTQHMVTFTVPVELVPKVKAKLALNAFVEFSGRYSTSEMVDNAQVFVKDVNYLDSGDIEYTLSIAPYDAIIDESAPG